MASMVTKTALKPEVVKDIVHRASVPHDSLRNSKALNTQQNFGQSSTHVTAKSSFELKIKQGTPEFNALLDKHINYLFAQALGKKKEKPTGSSTMDHYNSDILSNVFVTDAVNVHFLDYVDLLIIHIEELVEDYFLEIDATLHNFVFNCETTQFREFSEVSYKYATALFNQIKKKPKQWDTQANFKRTNVLDVKEELAIAKESISHDFTYDSSRHSSAMSNLFVINYVDPEDGIKVSNWDDTDFWTIHGCAKNLRDGVNVAHRNISHDMQISDKFKVLIENYELNRFKNVRPTGRGNVLLPHNTLAYRWADHLLDWIGQYRPNTYDTYVSESGNHPALNGLPVSDRDDKDVVALIRLLCNDTQVLYTQTGAWRVYIAKTFGASQSLGTNGGLPWFLDYVHLAFWFFYFSILIAVLWLIFFFSIVSKNIEARQPMRETRGFSRAQTGDGITAVLPMTWSITMLMHASTHSINFDENVSGTIFIFSIVAYQWGWNYYFPRDILNMFDSLAKIVGHGNIAQFNITKSYDKLLNQARKDMLLKSSNGSRDVNKFGKNVAPNAIFFFFKPNMSNTKFEQSLPFFLKTLYLNNGSTKLPESFLQLKQLNTATTNSLVTKQTESFDDGVALVTAGFTDSLNTSRLLNTVVIAQKQQMINNLDASVLNFNDWTITDSAKHEGSVDGVNLRTDTAALTQKLTTDSFVNQAGLNSVIFRENMLKHNRFDAHKDKSTTALISNRFQNIFKAAFLFSQQNKNINFSRSINSAQVNNAATAQTTISSQISNFLNLENVHVQNDIHTINSALSEFNIDSARSNLINLDNVAFNNWLFFFNISRYFAISDAQPWLSPWRDNIYMLNALSTGITNGANSMSLTDNNDPLILRDLRKSDLAVQVVDANTLNYRLLSDAAFIKNSGDFNLLNFVYSGFPQNKVLTQANKISMNFVRQLFTFTGVDTNFTASFSSLLNSDDFVLNFLPSTNEFLHTQASYSARNINMLLSQAPSLSTSVVKKKNDFNLNFSYFVDTASRKLQQKNNVATMPHSIEQQNSLIYNPTFLSYNEQTSVSDINFFFSLLPTNLTQYMSVKSAAESRELLSDTFHYDTIKINAFFPSYFRNIMQADHSVFGENPTVVQSSVRFPVRSQLLCKNSFTNTVFNKKSLFSTSNQKFFKYSQTVFPAATRLTIKQKSFSIAQPGLNPLTVQFHVLFNVSLKQTRVLYPFEFSGIIQNNSYNSVLLSNQDLTTKVSLLQDDLTFAVDSNRPVRSSNNKIMNSSFFASKLDALQGTPVKFSNTQLFDWSLSWSKQVLKYNAPLYKMTRGAVSKRPESSYWNESNGNSAIQILKWTIQNTEELLARGIPLKNTNSMFYFMYQPKKFVKPTFAINESTKILDNENSFFVKNWVLNLPKVHEEFDINFVYKYWTPEINTTRRGDHATRFKTTWSAFPATTQTKTTTVGFNFYNTFESSSWSPYSFTQFLTKVVADTIIFNFTSNQTVSGINSLTALLTTPSHLYFKQTNKFDRYIWQVDPAMSMFKYTDVRSTESATENDYASISNFIISSQFTNVKQYSIIDNLVSLENFLKLAKSTNFAPSRETLFMDKYLPQYVQNTIRYFAKNNQSMYEIIRGDIGSMRRLRVTRGICLPSDYPIHLVCGSKDVIHSWAVPGLGLKIDCIPGYNCHRRVLFRWRGVYWGQCMEVCGRYHHWMPIMVKIVHRDSFLSWCLIYLRFLNNRTKDEEMSKQQIHAVLLFLNQNQNYNIVQTKRPRF